MKAVGGLLLWMAALAAGALLVFAWRIGIDGLYGAPAWRMWTVGGCAVAAVAFLVLGLILTAPPKAGKGPGS